jgi:hypothetical protein
VSTEPTPAAPTSDVVGRQDLSSAFGPSSRTSGLGGRLKRPTAPVEPEPSPSVPSTAADTEDPQPVEPTPAQEPAKRRPAGERATKTTPRARTKPSDGPAAAPRAANTNYPVHVPADLVPLFNERRNQEGTSNTLLVFDAIDALVDHDSNDPYGRLREAVTGDVIGAQPSSLFTRAPRRARPSTDEPRARSQIMLRMSDDNRAVIEQLVTETGALDRSHLITVALTEFLTPTTR